MLGEHKCVVNGSKVEAVFILGDFNARPINEDRSYHHIYNCPWLGSYHTYYRGIYLSQSEKALSM